MDGPVLDREELDGSELDRQVVDRAELDGAVVDRQELDHRGPSMTRPLTGDAAAPATPTR